MSTDFVIVRHGQTDYNVEHKIQGNSDASKLTERGVEQAKALKKELGGTEFDSMYSSPLRRALETAKILADANEVKTDNRLEERCFGEITGMEWEDVERRFPAIARQYEKVKDLSSVNGAETIENVQERGMEFLKEVARANDGKRILVVTHSGWIKMIFAFLKGDPEVIMDNLKNCSINEIKWDGERFIPMKFNYVGHLS